MFVCVCVCVGVWVCVCVGVFVCERERMCSFLLMGFNIGRLYMCVVVVVAVVVGFKNFKTKL